MSEHLESDSSGIGLDIGMEEEPQPVHLGEEKQIIEDSDIITAMDEISEIVSVGYCI